MLCLLLILRKKRSQGQHDSEDVEKEMADKAAAEDDEEGSIEVVVEKSED